MPCTCGKCIAGVLSPRNAAVIGEAAAAAAELLRDSLPEFPGNQSLHDPEVYLLDFCPPELRLEVDKQFALGFACCIQAVAYVVAQGMLPKPRLVVASAPAVRGADKVALEFYLSHAGLGEYAVDAVLAQCENSPLGASTANGDGDSTFPPACANDGTWAILRQQIFSNSSFWPCGPYPMNDDGGFAEGEVADDGWVHYDTSNWRPPGQK